MSIHKRIRERRLALGMTSHKALAALLEVSWQTVQLWEKEGGTAPNRGRIEQVARVLGVSVAWLQHGGPDDAPKAAVPDTLADALKMTTETPAELRLLSIYRMSSKKNQRIIDLATEASGEDIRMDGANHQGK